MKRRQFVKATLLTPLVPYVVNSQPDDPEYDQQNPGREFYELRVYRLKNGRQRKVVEDFWQKAAIPALNPNETNVIYQTKKQLSG